MVAISIVITDYSGRGEGPRRPGVRQRAESIGFSIEINGNQWKSMEICEKDPLVGHSPESIFSPIGGAASKKVRPQTLVGKIVQRLVMNTTLFPRERANRAPNDKAEVPPRHQKIIPWIKKAVKSMKIN